MRKRILAGILVALLLIACWYAANLAIPMIGDIRDNLLSIFMGEHPMPQIADGVFYLLIIVCFLAAILIPTLKNGKKKDRNKDDDDNE